MREEDAILFRAAIAVRRDGEIVVALFDGEPMRNVMLLKGSVEAVRALEKELGSVLISDAE